MLFQPSLNVLSGYFYVSLNLTGILLFSYLAEFRDTAPLISLIRGGTTGRGLGDGRGKGV